MTLEKAKLIVYEMSEGCIKFSEAEKLLLSRINFLWAYSETDLRLLIKQIIEKDSGVSFEQTRLL